MTRPAFSGVTETQIDPSSAVKTENITIHRITRDEWGYPMALWSGNLGSKGGTRIEEKADAEAIVETVSGQFAYEEGNETPDEDRIEAAVQLAPDLEDER